MFTHNNRGSFVCFKLKVKMLRVVNYEILILFKLYYVIILKKENKRQNISLSTRCHIGKLRLLMYRSICTYVILHKCNMVCILPSSKNLNFLRAGTALLYL